MRIRDGILVALFAIAMALAPTADPVGAEPHCLTMSRYLNFESAIRRAVRS
jgi:hypothetical protein